MTHGFLGIRENCEEKMEQFLKRCFYHSGQYDSEQNFAELDKKLKEHEVICAWLTEQYKFKEAS